MSRGWPTVVVLFVCIFGALLFLGALEAVEPVRCHFDPHLAYCEGTR